MYELLEVSIGELVIINHSAVHSSASHHQQDLLSVLLCCYMTIRCSFFNKYLYCITNVIIYDKNHVIVCSKFVDFDTKKLILFLCLVRAITD